MTAGLLDVLAAFAVFAAMLFMAVRPHRVAALVARGAAPAHRNVVFLRVAGAVLAALAAVIFLAVAAAFVTSKPY